MKAKVAVVIFSLLVLAGVVLFMALEERNFTLVASAPTATRTPTKTPRLTRTLAPTNTPQPAPTRTPLPLPTVTPTPIYRPPTAEVSSTAFTPQPPPSPAPSPSPTRLLSPTARPQPTKTPLPTATLVPLKQFTGEAFWLSTYSPNCGSMGIGKRFSKVIDAQGKPVAGVVIKLWWPDASPDQVIYSDPTGPDGSFEIALGIPRDFTAYVAIHAHWGNPVESTETITIQFQAARGKDCLTPADGGTGLGHQWAIVVFKKHW